MCNLMHVGYDDWEAVELMNTNSLKEVKQFIADNFLFFIIIIFN